VLEFKVCWNSVRRKSWMIFIYFYVWFLVTQIVVRMATLDWSDAVRRLSTWLSAVQPCDFVRMIGSPAS
jgi:hypothetical protein